MTKFNQNRIRVIPVLLLLAVTFGSFACATKAKEVQEQSPLIQSSAVQGVTTNNPAHSQSFVGAYSINLMWINRTKNEDQKYLSSP